MLRCWICHGDDPGLIRVWRGAEVSVLRANRKQNLLHHAHAVDGPVAEDGFAVDVAAADGDFGSSGTLPSVSGAGAGGKGGDGAQGGGALPGMVKRQRFGQQSDRSFCRTVRRRFLSPYD